MNKEKQRSIYKKLRTTISDKELLDNQIAQRIINSPAFISASLLLAYYPLASEVSTIKIIDEAFKQNKKVALPVSLDNRNLAFYFINSLNNLTIGKYKILEPNLDNIVSDYYNSLCLVPGIAFDLNGYRIGYGMGYYDNFLKDYPGLTIGLCYSALVIPKVAINKCDIPVALIATEKSIHRVR